MPYKVRPKHLSKVIHFSEDGLNQLCWIAGGHPVPPSHLVSCLDDVTCKNCRKVAGMNYQECRVKDCGRPALSSNGSVKERLCRTHYVLNRKGHPLRPLQTHPIYHGGRKQGQRTCKVPGCYKKERTSLFCNRHYRNYLERGDPLKDKVKEKPIPKPDFHISPTRW